jgi:short subunit fatty acids transporter
MARVRLRKAISRALDLNTYNLIFITAGLLQWRPKRFLRAVMECVPGAAGVIIQSPLYAVIFGMIVGTGLSGKAARLLTSPARTTPSPGTCRSCRR